MHLLVHSWPVPSLRMSSCPTWWGSFTPFIVSRSSSSNIVTLIPNCTYSLHCTALHYTTLPRLHSRPDFTHAPISLTPQFQISNIAYWTRRTWSDFRFTTNILSNFFDWMWLNVIEWQCDWMTMWLSGDWVEIECTWVLLVANLSLKILNQKLTFIAFLATLSWSYFYFVLIPVAIPLGFIKIVCMYLLEKYNCKFSDRFDCSSNSRMIDLWLRTSIEALWSTWDDWRSSRFFFAWYRPILYAGTLRIYLNRTQKIG